jgi:hypothetical protein
MVAGRLSEMPIGRRKEKFERRRLELVAEPEWIARLTVQAERLGLSVSAYIRLAVTERLERDESQAPAPRAKKK